MVSKPSSVWLHYHAVLPCAAGRCTVIRPVMPRAWLSKASKPCSLHSYSHDLLECTAGRCKLMRPIMSRTLAQQCQQSTWCASVPHSLPLTGMPCAAGRCTMMRQVMHRAWPSSASKPTMQQQQRTVKPGRLWSVWRRPSQRPGKSRWPTCAWWMSCSRLAKSPRTCSSTMPGAFHSFPLRNTAALHAADMLSTSRWLLAWWMSCSRCSKSPRTCSSSTPGARSFLSLSE